jgi:pyruvate dehydrogenase E2 component (dihydrolipoamide acetyltransferase)
MKDLAARAKNRKLKPEEYQGGTTAVSNLGMFGIKDFAAVINPPHATILAVGAGEQRAVVKNGEIKVANVMSVTLSTDHRAVDGALGAELLQAFKKYIENPMILVGLFLPAAIVVLIQWWMFGGGRREPRPLRFGRGAA